MASGLDDKVITAKNALMTALGDNASKYLSNMKLWFRHKWSKEDFDYESRKYLTPDKIHLHNQFFVAILNKIDAFQMPKEPLISTVQEATSTGESTATSTSGSNSNGNRKRKRTSRPYIERSDIETFDILDFIEEDSMAQIRPANGTDANVEILPTQRYCVHELFLPDKGFIYGRYLIGAWESGLVNVEDNVAEYVAIAVQVLLKNLISAVIMKRKHYKITGEGSYYYDIGAPIRDPSVRNTAARQKYDDTPMELDKEITSPNFMRRPNDDGVFLSACEELYPQGKSVINLRDLQCALNDRNLIPSHFVYSINMERLTHMMH